VFRQIYPLRNAAGAITVAPDPVVATFDVRNTIGLQTPTGLEQRITQLACNYGVDTTAGEKSADAAQTTVAVDHRRERLARHAGGRRDGSSLGA
jgi:hypothetical protein